MTEILIFKIMKYFDTINAVTKFDGDEMNLHMPQDVDAETELRNLAAVQYQIISPGNNKPIIGVFQDSMLGSFRFSRENIHFTVKQAMNLLMMFQRVDESLFKDKKTITNFEILSQILPPISLHYKNKLFGDKDEAKTSNNVLEIKNGTYIRGQMDKGVLGDGSKGIIHRICNDYGNMASANFIDDLQNIITEYMTSSAYSVGISDLISDDKTKHDIEKVITEKKSGVKNLIDQTQMGVFENNTGKTNQEDFETKVNNILNQASSEAGKIGLKSLSKDNRFVIMVNAGSKGSDLNITQMISCLGQQNVDGRRIPYGFDRRTLPHYTKFDDSPSARGFVESSYINGLNPQELFFHAMAGRIGLIDTAVKSVTWETPIVIIENQEAKYTEIGRWIDRQLDDKGNVSKIQHFTARQMELMNIKEGDVYIPTTDENGVVTWGEVTAITRHDPGTELYEIKTTGGRSVIVTESKSLLIWNPETKKLKEMPTPEIKVGDCVPVTRELCEPPIVVDSIDMKGFYNDKFMLNEENGTFIGLFLAKGRIEKSIFKINTENKTLQEFVEKYVNEGITSGNFVLNYLSKLIEKGNEHVPEESYIAPKEFVVGLLSGYYTENSIIGEESISVESSSKKLLEGINMLLSRFGIFGTIENVESYSYVEIYSLEIRAQWGKIFADKVPLLEEKKQERLRSIRWGKSHRNFDTYNDVVLDKITEINIIGVEKHPKVYDLTIPSTLNFGIANGMQVRDTSTTGYIQRRLIKGLEDLMVNYDMTVRTNKGKIVEFAYGDDNIDPIKVENQPIPLVTMSIQEIYSHYNIPEEAGKMKTLSEFFLKNTMTRYKKQNKEIQVKCKFYTDFMIQARDDIIKNIFKYKGDSMVSSPVAFALVVNNVQGQMNLTANSIVDITPLEAFEMIESTFANLEKIRCAPPTALFKVLYYFNLSPKELLIVKRFNKAALTLLLETIVVNYKRAIVAPGEMVGMIAAQSIGEPSTQMSTIYSEKLKIIKVNKKNKNSEMESCEIGKLCDDLIEKLPEYTFNTGHKNSVETLLEALEDEYYIVGVDEKEKTHWNKISHVSRHPVNGDLMKVKTKSGRIVETTTSHSHLVRSDQKVVPITGSELKVGMRIPVAKNIDNTFVKEFVVVDNKEYKLDYLFGWFIGAYLAEGNLNGNQINITNVNEYFIENTKKMASIFGKEGKTRTNKGEYGPSVTTSFNHKKFAEFIKNTCDNGSFVKRVPDFAFTAPNEFKGGLLQAYFDGDGNFNNDTSHHCIRSCSRSEQLTKDMALLLNYFGIFGYMNSTHTRGSMIHNLSISPKYCLEYRNSIGSVVHKDKLNELVDYIYRKNVHDLAEYVDKINGLGEIIATCGKKLKLDGQSRNYGRWKKKESIGRRTLEKYIQIFESHENVNDIKEEMTILKQAATSSVIWDEITNIEVYTPEQTNFVYDFTVPGNQTFMTDYGVIIHNTLNTFHHTGISSKSNVTRGVPRLEEILSLSSEPKNPSLTVFMKPEDQTDREKAQSIMYMLEHTNMEEIVQSTEICFDPDDLNTLIEEDKDTIEQYRTFEGMMDECNEVSLTDDTNEKSKWILRMEMDAETMLEKNITMDDIHFTLKNSFGDEINCIYSDYNSDKLIFRIRMNSVLKPSSSGPKKIKVNPLDQSDQIYLLKNFQDQILNNVVIRGIKKINKVILRKIKDTVVEEAGVYKKQDIWVLDTVGSNLLDVMALDYIDTTRTITNDIVETYNIFGIEAARQTIYNELVEVIEFDGTYVNFHHMCMLCDRMTYTNKMISIFRHGINNDNIGPIAKASFEETPEMFLKAARHAELDLMRGVSANIMCGQEGLYGTNLFQVVLDLEEMKKLNDVIVEETMADEDAIEKIFGDFENQDDKCSTQNLTIENNVGTIQSADLGQDDDYEPGF